MLFLFSNELLTNSVIANDDKAIAMPANTKDGIMVEINVKQGNALGI
jgi:hypothetical protein